VGDGGLTADPAADRRADGSNLDRFPASRGLGAAARHVLFTALLRACYFALAESIPIG